LGRGDTNKKLSNVFKYAAEALGYTNVNVPLNDIPKGNGKITGLLTGKSYNQTRHRHY
jgi:hypothetical protein